MQETETYSSGIPSLLKESNHKRHIFHTEHVKQSLKKFS